MLADVGSYDIPVLRVCVCQNPLDQVVAILIAGNVNERNSRSIHAALTDPIKIAAQKVASSNLQTLLHYLGSILIHAVLCSEANDVIDGSASIWRSAMLADMLNAPVTELAVGDNVNVCKDFFYAGTLFTVS